MNQNSGSMMQIVDTEGHRLYLTKQETESFLAAAATEEGPVKTLCAVMAYTGCRLSEARTLTAGRVELDEGVIVFESLKKRRQGVYRRVPVPPWVLQSLDDVHGIRRLQKTAHGKRTPIWQSNRHQALSRAQAYRRIVGVMQKAGIQGPQASPKGLRHGFGVRAVTSGISLSSVQRWLGHAQLSTTAIYAQAVGAEERELASKMWA